jgi:hypothetical protein
VVKDILGSVVYLGHTAAGKNRINAAGKQEAVPKEQWVTVPDTHEPIIAQYDFDAVQEQLLEAFEKCKNSNRHNREELPPNIFDGLIFCSDCGRVYRRITDVMRDKVTYRITYVCAHCNRHSPKYKYKYFRQCDLFNAVYELIRSQMEVCSDLCEMIKRANSSENAQRQRNNEDGKIKAVQNRLERLDLLKLKLYGDLREGIISENEYRLLSSEYDNERSLLLSEAERRKEKIKKMSPEYADENEYALNFKRFLSEKGLTREMLVALVERIEVDGNRNIEIKFRYADEYERLAELAMESGVLK